MTRTESEAATGMDFLISRNAHFVVEHCYSCAVPGYLIVSPIEQVESISGLSNPAQAGLGPMFARATELVTAAVQPVRIYCAQFGEEDARLHFHVFPRSRELTDRYLEDYPDQAQLIHGPVLLHWARATFAAGKADVWAAVAPVVAKLRELDAARQAGD